MKFPEKKHEDLSLFLEDYSLGIQKGFESINFKELEKIANLMNRTINYGRVLEIMGMLSGAGFSKVALISEPSKER